MKYLHHHLSALARKHSWKRMPIFFAALSCISVCAAQTNVATWHNDNLRTGLNANERTLTPANVHPATFGKLFTVPVDGKVDAQPLHIAALNMPGHGQRDVVFVATEHDSVYAFDAAGGVVFWHVSLLRSGETPSDSRSCGQVVPEIGITATPVIDRTVGPHGVIYVVAMSKDRSGNYYHRLHALDITTGAEELGGPTLIQASYPGNGANSVNGSVVFDAKEYKDRPGLLLLNGIVYTSWGSHCDYNPYTGWLIGYNHSTLRQTSVFNLAPNGSEAALWNAGAGPAADPQGNIFLSVANGTFDNNLNAQGFPAGADYGNAFVKLSISGNRTIVDDYWTMADTHSESARDADLGSGGIMLLPDTRDSSGRVRHLAMGGGKDANLYVVDRDHMGKYNSSSNSTIYQELPEAIEGGMFSTPAYFDNHVYFGPINNAILSFEVRGARVSSLPVSATAHAFGYPGATPSISANGNSNAILWAVENSNPAVLHAYDANDLGTELYNSDQAGSGRDHLGPGNKYIVPTIADGRVFVGTQNSVAVFGLLSRAAIPNGTYTVTNETSGLVLDDPGFSRQAGMKIQQYASNGGANQKWRFVFNGSGFYTIQNASSNLFLTNPGGSSAAGVLVEQDAAGHGDSQLWSLSPAGSGFVIHNKGGGTVLDDPGLSRSSGTRVQMYPQNGGANQTWLIH